MSLEEKVKQYKTLTQQIDALEAQKKELGIEILEQMQQKTITLSNYIVRRYERLSYRTPIEVARTFQATKTEEVLDKDKLKALYHLGQEIPGVTQYSVIQVSLAKEAPDGRTV